MEKQDQSTAADNDLPGDTLDAMMDAEFGTNAPVPANDTPEVDDNAGNDDAERAEELAKAFEDAKPPETPEPEPDDSEASTDGGDNDASNDGAELDDFDKETERHLEEMKHDPTPGRKFQQLRAELKEAKQARDEAITGALQSEEVQRLKLEAEQAATLKQEVEDLRASLALNDYKATPEFDSLVKKPLSEIEVLAKGIEEANGLTAGSALSAIKSDNQADQTTKIDNLVSEGHLSARDQNRLYTAADRFLQVKATDASLKESASDRMQELQSMEVSQAAEREARQASELKSSIESTFAKYEGRVPGFITDDGLATENYSTLRNDAAGVKLDSVEDQSFAIMAATLLPTVLENNKSLATELADARKALSRYGKAKPSAGTPAPAEVRTAKATSFMDSMEKAFG